MSATSPLAGGPTGPESSLLPAPDDIRAETESALHPDLTTPVQHRWGWLAFGIVGIVIASLALLFVAFLFLTWLGPGATAIAAILALVPLTVVLLGVRWIDRWEPEPRSLLFFGFVWGGGMAVTAALLVGTTLDDAVGSATAQSGAYDVFSSVVTAPIVEETAKGLGILLIFLFARRAFDGPVDGVVYAGVIAGGFAFTENIEYFALEFSDPAGSIAGTFFIRGILSPFAHVMFTAMTGLLIGFAAQRGGRLLGVGGFFVGLIPAILLHAFWNGALYVVDDFFVYYALVQVPLFALAIFLVVRLRRREMRITQLRLAEYAAAGWFNASELQSLGTPTGRRLARGWAKTHGLRKLMANYINDATHLAFARDRIVNGRDTVGALIDEAELLSRVTESRRALVASIGSDVPAAVSPPATPAG